MENLDPVAEAREIVASQIVAAVGLRLRKGKNGLWDCTLTGRDGWEVTYHHPGETLVDLLESILSVVREGE